MNKRFTVEESNLISIFMEEGIAVSYTHLTLPTIA